MLLFVPPEKQEKVRESLKKLIYVPFRFDSAGSQIIFFDPQEEYFTEAMARASKAWDANSEAQEDVVLLKSEL
jgi:D-glycero-alpha-D-manno-heptose-7-phosphate kinase